MMIYDDRNKVEKTVLLGRNSTNNPVILIYKASASKSDTFLKIISCRWLYENMKRYKQ